MPELRHRTRFALVAAAALVLTLAAGACGAPSSGPKVPTLPVGTVTDNGFRPDQNGFQFSNYGTLLSDGSTAPINMTSADVEKMFGGAVCVDAPLRKCDLVPAAQAWLDEINQAIAGGHCYGFSVLADLLWQGKVSSASYGAPSANGLQIYDNANLQRQIAYDWALQTLDGVQSERISGTPNSILLELISALKPHAAEAYTIVFWKRDGTAGHAVTPFAVTNRGGGVYDALIYDNNWPGDTRAITFDTRANRWSYNASVNPNEADSLYTGDAKSKTISLDPVTPGLGTQGCPFCGKVPDQVTRSQGQSNTAEISLMGRSAKHANLIISDDAGHKLGYIKGQLVDQIPGARAEPIISNSDWNSSMEPDFVVPADRKYTFTLDGRSMAAADDETLYIIGPSSDLALKNLMIQPGEKDTLALEPDATHLSYKSSRPETPTIDMGISDHQADYAFQVTGVTERPGSTLNIDLPAEGRSLRIQIVGSDTASVVNFKVARETESGVESFQHHGIPLGAGNSAQFQFADWPGAGQPLPLTVSQGGQASTQTLVNQAPS